MCRRSFRYGGFTRKDDGKSSGSFPSTRSTIHDPARALRKSFRPRIRPAQISFISLLEAAAFPEIRSLVRDPSPLIWKQLGKRASRIGTPAFHSTLSHHGGLIHYLSVHTVQKNVVNIESKIYWKKIAFIHESIRVFE